MNCPRCDALLSGDKTKNILVDRCPECKGLWLDYDELDELEDVVLDDDPAKGSLLFRSYQGSLQCPVCQSTMEMFHYRAYDLELDMCPNEHGFWLDGGEEKRVLGIMKQRIKDIKRSSSAEEEWAGILRSFKSKSFLDKFRGMFRG